MIRIAAVLALGSAFFFACSAQAQVGAPFLGYVPDKGLLRPVYGIPAAAAVGAPLNYGRIFSSWAVSPQQDYTIAIEAGTGTIFLATAAGMIALPDSAAAPDGIAISPRGSSAAFLFVRSGRLQIFSGLPGQPRVREININFTGGSTNALAVTDDGSFAVGAWKGGLRTFGPNGEAAIIPMRERALALAFYSGTHDLAAATVSSVLSIADVGGRAAVSTLFTAAPGKRLVPAGIALSAGNDEVVLAERSGSVTTIDIAQHTHSQLNCGCDPEGVFRMGAALFRLTVFNGTTFRLLDASKGDLFFVPLAANAGGAQ